ncbi:MAG: hypothetical protein HY822_24985 [Acidobacteria bacterium]|nr:hypothetical protein [Acidobacteriota bacterium]
MTGAGRQALVALVGGETLLGREVRDVFHTAQLAAKLKLIGAADEAAGTLTEQEGEPVVVSALDEEHLLGAGVAILAGTPESSRKAFGLLARRSPRPAVIDLSGALETIPEARLRAPMVEPRGFCAGTGDLHIIAHPAAVALTLLLRRVPARRSVVQVLVPASEQGQRGVAELQQQVIRLFSFQPLPKEVFDAQVAFNLRIRYGAEAPCKLETAEECIGRHLGALLAHYPRSARPSFRLLQAPVFHGYGFSIWLELEQAQDPLEFAAGLASPGVEVRTADQEAPDNVGVAGDSGVIVGAVERDGNDSQALWLWAVADNLRLTAVNAVTVARQVLEARAQ